MISNKESTTEKIIFESFLPVLTLRFCSFEAPQCFPGFDSTAFDVFNLTQSDVNKRRMLFPFLENMTLIIVLVLRKDGIIQPSA